MICLQADPLGKTLKPADPTKKSRDIGFLFGMFVIFLAGLAYYYFNHRYIDYVLLNDEPGFLAGTLRQDPWKWFTRGYALYFETYPEWFTPSSNFLRPVTNIVIWLESQIFHDQYGYYFITYYISIFSAFYFTYRCLTKITNYSLYYGLVALLWLMSPAVISPGLWSIPFMFDVMAAAMTVAAFWFLMQEKYATVLTLLILSVFTKETALFAPVAAAATLLVLRYRSLAWAALMMVPVGLWCVARYDAFGRILGGTYLGVGAGSLLSGLSIWPSGIEGITNFFEAIQSGRPINYLTVLAGSAAFVNLLTVIVLLVIYARFGGGYALKRRLDLGAGRETQAAYFYAAMIWFGGALGYVVVTGVSGRFGADVYLFLGILLVSAAELDPRAWGRRLAIFCLLAMIGLFSMNALISIGFADRLIAEQSRLARSLDTALRQIPPDAKTILLVNGPPIFSSPQSIAAMQGVTAEFSLLNQFQGCLDPTPGSGTGRFEPVPQGWHIVLPDCAGIAFLGVTLPAIEPGAPAILRRDGFGLYRFKTLKQGANSQDDQFGHEFSFEPEKNFSAIIAYDWRDAAYHVIPSPKG